MGHLPGTGLLEAADEALVAAVVTREDNDSGLGLRTMSQRSGGYAPLSYHCGSVWPHDTAITLLALSRAGLGGHAAGLLTGLVEAAEAFSYRLPELWSGDALAELGRPVPYPAACHPQAWSVTSAVAAVQVLLGLQVDVPGRTATLRPLRPSPVGALRVEGLLVAGEPCTVEVDAAGEVLVAEGAGLRWDVLR
jgi:glycogen debranching enzyme